MPEPGPVGVNVEPLGEPLGASVLPDGFVVVLGVLPVAGALPTVEPGGFPIPLPFMDEPVVVPGAAALPGLELPDIPPLVLCASANVLESAIAPANAIVMSFMVVSLVDDQGETSTGGGCSGALNTNTKTSEEGTDGGDQAHPSLWSYFASVGRIRILHKFQMRSSTMKLTLSAFSPSPGVR